MRPDAPYLVAVDVDGTLLDTEFEDVLREREIRALEAVRAAGHVVALCTGRNLRSVQGLLEGSGWTPADLPLILLNGALVWGGRPRRCLASRTLEGPVIRELVRLFREHDTVPMIYGSDEDGGVLHHERRPVNDILARYLGQRERTVGSLSAVEDLLALPWSRALEVGTIDEEAKVRALTAAIEGALEGRVRVINTRSLLGGGRYFWAECFSQGSDKGAGVRVLAAELGIAADRVVAIGDNFNDLEMFDAAAISVAMGNSPREVKQRADYVTADVTAGGAAEILEGLAAGTFPGSLRPGPERTVS